MRKIALIVFCIILLFPVCVHALPDEIVEIYEASGVESFFENNKIKFSEFDAESTMESLVPLLYHRFHLLQ